MRSLLGAFGLLACAVGAALAGPNHGGTIFAHDASLVYTTDTVSCCGLGAAPAGCEGADTRIDASGSAAWVFKVYAAFVPGTSPRLKAMTFGVYYPDDIGIAAGAFGPCVGDMNAGGGELQGPGWPASDTGTAIVFQNTQTTELVEAYWFAGYAYYGNAGVFALGPHPDPTLGGVFCDDSIGCILDLIAGYGTLGFNTRGQTACPEPIPPPDGACCYPDGHCEFISGLDCPTEDWRIGVPCDPNPCPQPGACCTDLDGDHIPESCSMTLESECAGQWDGSPSCEPNPCPVPPNPVREATWGRVKSAYR